VLALIDHMIAGGFTEQRFRDLVTPVDSLDALVADYESRSHDAQPPILGQYVAAQRT
jgi:hypothetical protein